MSNADVTSSLIVGGTESPKGRYPYQVNLINDCGSVCGGSLIAPNYVLSAAHCAGSFSKAQIGRHDLSNLNEIFEEIDIIVTKKHPEYDSSSNANDIMLVVLNGSSQYTPIALDTGTQDLSEGADVTVMGWGTTQFEGQKSSKLLEVEVDIVSSVKCQSIYQNHNISKDMICARREGKDSCQGDSGGPLIVKGANALSDVQVGVVSWGIGCALQDIPGVYSNISYHYEWITSTMKKSITNLEKLKSRAIRLECTSC